MINLLENEEGTTRPSGISPEREACGYPYHASLITNSKKSYKAVKFDRAEIFESIKKITTTFS